MSSFKHFMGVVPFTYWNPSNNLVNGGANLVNGPPYSKEVANIKIKGATSHLVVAYQRSKSTSKGGLPK